MIDSEGLWIVNVCQPDNGWQKPVIFSESQQTEMEQLIAEEQHKLNTVVTTRLTGREVDQLRPYLLFRG